MSSRLIPVSSNYYGTTIAAVEEVAKTGRKCILDIEMEVSPLQQGSLGPRIPTAQTSIL